MTRKQGPRGSLRCRKIVEITKELRSSGIMVQTDVDLRNIARWRIGGPADIMVSPRSAIEIARTIKVARSYGLPIFAGGDGSNMLYDENGFRGVFIHIANNLSAIKIADKSVLAGAGVWVPALARNLATNGLSGLEHTVGIPGRLGGLTVMNGGSQRKGVGDHIDSVVAVTNTGNIEKIYKKDLKFSYRRSILQEMQSIVAEVEISLDYGDVHTIRREMIDILANRRRKFPKSLPNCGSTFLSNPEMYTEIGPPGYVIEKHGLKGISIGGAQVSPMHANFLVNRGNASSNDILALIALIRKTVLDQTGHSLDCEVRYLDQYGEQGPAHVFTDLGRFDQSLLDCVEYPKAQL